MSYKKKAFVEVLFNTNIVYCIGAHNFFDKKAGSKLSKKPLPCFLGKIREDWFFATVISCENYKIK